MTKAKGTEIGILASTSIRDRERGRQFLQSLMVAAPAYAPARYNDHEPVKHRFDVDDLDAALNCWGMSFFWRAIRTGVSGGALVGFRGAHDKVNLRMPIRALEVPMIGELFKTVEESFGVDLAYVHVRTDSDTADVDHYVRHLMPFQTLTTHDLREGLPDLPWAMLFGPPYVELFGRPRLLATPAARTEEIGAGIYIQLTRGPEDVANNRDAYLAAQRAAKSHLNSGAFRSTTETTRLSVPSFTHLTW